MFFKKIFALSFAMLILSSCVETVVVGTVAAGAYVAGNRNKSITTSKKNNYILDGTETMSLKDYLKNNPNKKGLKNVNVNVFEKIIMLTGYVNNSNLKTLVGGIAKSKKPNNEIINEIMVFDNDYNVSSFRDSVISFRISWKLKGASEIHSNNYKYDVALMYLKNLCYVNVTNNNDYNSPKLKKLNCLKKELQEQNLLEYKFLLLSH